MKLTSVSRLAALAFAGALALSSAAHADSKAWNELKAKLGPDAQLIAGVNVSAIKSSKLVQQLLPQVLSKMGSSDQIDQLTKVCKLEPLTSIDSFVIATDSSDKGIVTVSLAGANRSSLEACAKKLSGAQTITIGKDGALTSYAVTGDTAWVAWLSNDTVVIPTEPADKAALTKWIGGGFAKSAIAKLVGTTKTSSAVWLSTTKSNDLDAGQRMVGAFGNADLAAGKINVNAHLTLQDAKAAADAVAKANKQLVDAKQNPPMPALAPIIDGIKLSAAGSDMVVSVSLGEDQVMMLVGMAMATAGAVAPPPPPPPAPAPPSGTNVKVNGSANNVNVNVNGKPATPTK